MRRKIFLFVVSLLSLVLLIFGAYQYISKKSEYDNKKEAYELLKSQSEMADLKRSKQVVYVTDTGVQDEVNEKNIKQIKSLFERIFTYTSGAEYAENRAYALTKIKDEHFFEKLMNEDKDATGNSYIDALNLKSISDEVIVTSSNVHPYQVVVKYIPYHKESDLRYKSKLIRKQYIIQFDYKEGKFIDVRIKPIKAVN